MINRISYNTKCDVATNRCKYTTRNLKVDKKLFLSYNRDYENFVIIIVKNRKQAFKHSHMWRL